MSESELEHKLNQEAETQSRLDIIKAAVIKVNNDTNNERRLNLDDIDYSNLGDVYID